MIMNKTYLLEENNLLKMKINVNSLSGYKAALLNEYIHTLKIFSGKLH